MSGPFTQRRLSQMLKAAKAAGLDVAEVKCSPDGWEIRTAPAAKEAGDALADKALQKWRERHADRRA